MDRKLASIQRIVSLDPIPGADKIEKATVLGWEIVVSKSDKFKVGEKVIYIEVDSVVPPKPEFEFLKERKYRVRTIKLRGQVSQGLILPIDYLGKLSYLPEGTDVTGTLGIVKYDSQAEKEQKLLDEKLARSNNKVNKFLSRYPWYRRILTFFMPKKAGWPKFIKKTDEDRIQLFPHICEDEKDTVFSVTEKLDGQSATYFLLKNKNKFLWFGEDYIFGVCSRNLYLPKPDNSSYWTIARQLDIKTKLKKLINKHDFVALQGEIIGEGIQGNKYKIKGYDFYAFNLKYPDKTISTHDMDWSFKILNINVVPILDEEFKLLPTIPENVEYAKGKSVINPDVLREGIVVRNYEKNISFKIINPDFLLKFEE